jgi:putative hemolysin
LLGNAFSRTPGFFNTPEIQRRKNKRLQPIRAAQNPHTMAGEINRLPENRILVKNGGLAVYLAHAQMIPKTLQEIGCQREIKFRQVGEGTGKATDLDRFDEHCRHLLVWDHPKNRIVGAYRMGLTDEIIRKLC